MITFISLSGEIIEEFNDYKKYKYFYQIKAYVLNGNKYCNCNLVYNEIIIKDKEETIKYKNATINVIINRNVIKNIDVIKKRYNFKLLDWVYNKINRFCLLRDEYVINNHINKTNKISRIVNEMKLLEYNPGRQPKIDWEQVHQEMENDRIYREFVYQKMQKEKMKILENNPDKIDWDDL